MGWPTAAQLQVEDGAPFRRAGELQQEDLVEAALAQQLGRQPFHGVGGGNHEHGAALLRHPGEHAGQHPLAGAAIAAAVTAAPHPEAEALVDLIDPEHAGGHRLGPLDHLPRAGLTGPHQPREQPPHIQPQQRHAPAVGDRLGGEALAGALGPHQQHTPRQGQAVAARLLAKGPVALLQPVLERLQTADIGGAGLAGAILQQFAAGDRLAFLLQHLGQIRLPQAAPLGQGPGRQLAHPLLTEAVAGAGQLGQHCRLQWFAAGRRDARQQPGDLVAIGKGQFQHGHAVLQFGR